MVIITAVVVFKASNFQTGLLWIPSLCIKRHCQTGLQDYNVGDWLRIDNASRSIVRINGFGLPNNQTRLFDTQGDTYVEINTPVVFFSGQASNNLNLVIAYSPEFGRIAFIPQAGIRMDIFYSVWIAYMALCHDENLLMVMRQFNVDWVISEFGEPMTNAEMLVEDRSGHRKFSNGIVVRSYENVELGADQHTPKIWKVVDIWSPTLSDEKVPGLCTHRIDQALENSAEQFTVGTLCKFVPILNFSGTYTAVNLEKLSTPMAGIEVIQTRPSLKLKIGHEHYMFNSEPMALCLHMPKLLGQIYCKRKFIEQIPRGGGRQRPWISAEFNGQTWKVVAIGFDSSAIPCQVPTFTNYCVQGGYQTASTSAGQPFANDNMKTLGSLAKKASSIAVNLADKEEGLMDKENRSQ